MRTKAALFGMVLAFAGCSSSSGQDPDATFKSELPQKMHDSLQDDLSALIVAAKALQAAAPDHAWDATADAAAIANMKKAWRDCRIAYEHVEGALAPIFPDIDGSLDARYDDFLAQLGGKGDADPFDDQGVTGMHAIERILYAKSMPKAVVDFESTLPGYLAAAYPADATQAGAFKTKLVQRLIDDAQKLKDEWQPAAIDLGVAFQGLIALMNEQKEKVNKAATGEEESRYAEMTLFDLRNNLEGTAKIYALFQPWILSKKSSDTAHDGPSADANIQAAFASLKALYNSDPGDAIPEPPTTWSSDKPTAEDLGSPFGKLWSSVHDAVDPTKHGSVVSDMNGVATILGFPQFIEAK